MDLATLFNPPATFVLILINCIVSGYAFTVDRNLNNQLDLDVRRVLDHKEYYRLMTSGFVHGDPIHLLFNMFTLYVFGRVVENILGTVPFLILYFGSELAANVLTLVLKRAQRGYASLGASGAVCGVVLSYCLFQPLAKIFIMPFPIGIPAFIYGICYIGYSSFQVRENVRDGTAHEAHLGGALAGLLLTVFFQPEALSVFLHHFGL